MSKLIVEMEMPVKEWNCLDCKAICADLMRGHYCGITKKTIDTLNAAADALERLTAEVDRKDKAIQGLLTRIEKLQLEACNEQQP